MNQQYVHTLLQWDNFSVLLFFICNCYL